MSWSPPRTERLSWLWLGLLCLYALLHSVTYALGNPVFESPDEPDHLAFVNQVAGGAGLPDQYGPTATREGHQHPLYYLLAGTGLRLFGGPIQVDLPRSAFPYPGPRFAHREDPFGSTRDQNLYYGLRLAGAVMAALTALQIGRAARLLLPVGHVWLVAPLVIATLPQFAFISASISNDGLVILLCSCLTYATVRCALESEKRSHWIAVGIWLGLALLTKKSAVAFIPPIALLAIVLAITNPSNKRVILKNGAVALAIAFVLFLPILIRNQLLYHELLGTQMEVATRPDLAQPHSLDSAYFQTSFLESVPRSFVGQLGWMNLLVDPTNVWWIVRGLLLAMILSLVAFLDRSRLAVTAFCWSAFVCSFIGVVYYNTMFPQPQGRLLFPALAPFALLCALGLYEVSKRVRIPYKWVGIVLLALYLTWFDNQAIQTNQSFYAAYDQAAQPS